MCRQIRRCSLGCVNRGKNLGVPVNRCHCPFLSVTQLQVTLASVQELLTQQQQKVQELAHELATAKVLVFDPPAPPGLPRTALHACPLCPVHCIPLGLTFLTPVMRWAHTCRERRHPVTDAVLSVSLSPPNRREAKLSACGPPGAAHAPALEAVGVDTEWSSPAS